ncbi:MAG: TIGR04282 family arsenosugar biosynthesis glycosyltransferase [Proteobacteria bacterium]|nr:TIGR04282 family arsenosugar biosynthesis glycosyltransferase [Burkholderiales bacterium]
MSRVLQVFAKAPVEGSVKTRLMPPLDARGAASLHAALVERTLAMVTGARGIVDRVELWCAPSASHPFFARCAQNFAITLRVQTGDDLGQRMHHALSHALGYGDVPVLIGSDCPTMSRTEIGEAFEAIAGAHEPSDIALMPTEDGGYALIGARRVDMSLFAGIGWGGDQVYAQSLARADALGWRVHCLRTSWDVDRPEDLVRLRALMPEMLELATAT